MYKEARHQTGVSKINSEAPQIKKFNYGDVKEKRAKGLCFKCDEKYAPGHVCQKLFLIDLVWDGDEEVNV